MTRVTADSPILSFIVPAYNEEAFLPDTLAEVTKILRKKPFSSDIIVVDDGSTDQTSAVVAKFPQVRVLRNETNRGKGYSVRRGMLEARGRFRIFADADLSVTMMEMDNLLPSLKGWPQSPRELQVDLAIATRRAPGARIAKRQSLPRHLSGLAYGRLVETLFGLGIRDCQCGFKAFTADAAELLFARQTIDGFTFDTELLVIAKRLGLSVAEIPVVWFDRPGTSLSFRRHTRHIVKELSQIRHNLHAGLYDAAPSPAGNPHLGRGDSA